MPSYYDYRPSPRSSGGTLRDVASGDDRYAQILLAGGQAQAEAYQREGDIWANAIGGAGAALTGALQKREDEKARDAVSRATSPQYPSATQAGPPGSGVPIDPGSYQGPPGMTAETSGRVPDPGKDHIKAILDSVSPESRPKVEAQIAAHQDSARKIQAQQYALEKQAADLQKAHADFQQSTADHWYGVAMDAQEHLKDPDGGIGAVAVGGLVSSGVPGADQVKKFAADGAQAMQAAQGDPAKQAQIADQFRQQVTPLIQHGLSGGSLAAQKSYAETRKAMAETQPKTRTLKSRDVAGNEVETIVPDVPGQSATSAAKVEPGSFEAFVRSRFGPQPTADQQIKAREIWAEAGRDKGNDAAPTLTQQGLDMAALQYRKTGQMVPMGMGRAGATVRQAVINRAATMTPEQIAAVEKGGADVATSKAEYGADTKALSQLTRQTEAVGAFEKTATKNAKLLDDVLKKIPDTGTSILNRPIRALAGAVGSEDIATFNAIRQSVQNEYSRIISNPTLSGTMSDSARKEGEALLSGALTVGQLRAALKVLQAEASNRHTSYQEQIGEIKGRMGGTVQPTAAGAGPKVGDKKTFPNGNTAIWDGHGWLAQ
jgi:hypothetical protein